MLKHATKVCPNATSEQPFPYFIKSYNKKLGIGFLICGKAILQKHV